MDRFMTTLADRRWPLLALLCGVLGPLSIFSALAEDVWDREGFAWDVPLLRAIHGYATPPRDAVMIVITRPGGVWGMLPLCALAVLVLLARRRHRDALFVGSVIVLGVSEPRSAITQTLWCLWVRDWCSPLLGRQPGSAAGSVVLPSYIAADARRHCTAAPGRSHLRCRVITFRLIRRSLRTAPSYALGSWTE
jgi:hypothetical protein